MSAEIKRKDSETAKFSADTAAHGVVSKTTLIRLNVGGKKFSTTMATLQSRGCTFFDALADGSDKTHKHFPLDEKGRFFLDRNPKTFSVVLEYLRNGVIVVPSGMKMDQIDLEFKFFGIPFPNGDRSEYTEPWRKRAELWVDENWSKVLKLLQEETPVGLPFTLRVSRSDQPKTLVCDESVVDSVPFWYYVSVAIRHRYRYEATISANSQVLTLSPIDHDDLIKTFTPQQDQLRTHFP